MHKWKSTHITFLYKKCYILCSIPHFSYKKKKSLHFFFSALFLVCLISTICASQVQTAMNTSKPQQRHNGYT